MGSCERYLYRLEHHVVAGKVMFQQEVQYLVDEILPLITSTAPWSPLDQSEVLV